MPRPPQVQKELRLQQELSDVLLRTQQEKAGAVQIVLSQQLEECRREINELGELRVQVSAKEEVVERLMREKEAMASRLGQAEHQLAVMKGGAGSEVRQRGEEERRGEEEGLVDEEDGEGADTP